MPSKTGLKAGYRHKLQALTKSAEEGACAENRSPQPIGIVCRAAARRARMPRAPSIVRKEERWLRSRPHVQAAERKSSPPLVQPAAKATTFYWHLIAYSKRAKSPAVFQKNAWGFRCVARYKLCKWRIRKMEHGVQVFANCC